MSGAGRIRIVNGEIVRGGDGPAPRAGASTPSSSSPSSSGPRFGSLHGTGTAGGGADPAPLYRGGGGSAGAAAPGAGAGVTGIGPLDSLAETLGAKGKVWTSPQVPSLGWNHPVQIPLIYLYIPGILILISLLGGWRGEMRILVASALALGIYIHSSQPRAPGQGQGHGQGQGQGQRGQGGQGQGHGQGQRR